jgi:hypothetical protein
MKRPGRRSIAIVAAAVGGLLLILTSACGGGTKYSGPPAATPSPSPEPSSLTDLDRYHYVAALELHGSKADGSANSIVVTTEGDYQSPDRHAHLHDRASRWGGPRERCAHRRQALAAHGRPGLARGDTERPAGDRALRRGVFADQARLPGRAGVPRRARQRPPAAGDAGVRQRLCAPTTTRSGRRVWSTSSRSWRGLLLLNVQDMHWDVWLAQQGAWPVRLLALGQ